MPALGFVLLFLEFYLLIVLASTIGFGFVLAEIVFTGFVGYLLMRYVGRKAFQPAQLIGVFLHAGRKGLATRQPTEWLLLGSLLLIIPGLLTDVLGAGLIIASLFRGGAGRQPRSKSESIDIDFQVHDDTRQ